MEQTHSSLTRRDVLKLGGAALAASATGSVLASRPVEAQTPKRGGRFRLRSHVAPVHFDPHQTIAFSTMIPLSFAYSRLVKVKGGSAVVPGTQPIEGDLAESWERQGDTVYVFKLRKGVPGTTSRRSTAGS
jgi:ABC-type transport system substrate-binding protein